MKLVLRAKQLLHTSLHDKFGERSVMSRHMISVDYNYTDLHIECFLTCLNYLDDMKDSIHIV